jgi:arsenate reductase
MGLATSAVRSKSWDEFANDAAPAMDFLITVCDDAAAEQCPVWPGRTATAHWAIEDPAAVNGSEESKRKAFRDAAEKLRRHIESFVSLTREELEAIRRRASA